jgi:hypothetical protein
VANTLPLEFPKCLLTSHDCNPQLTPLIVACSVIAGETACLQSCFLTIAVVLLPVYTAVNWHWVCLSVALQPFVGPWSLLQFLDLLHSR